jgi:thioredoxin-dependent peroxiredoxin
MEERKGAVTFKGKPMTLLGKEIRPGDHAPDFEATDVTLTPVKLSSFLGKTVIISSVISLDTPTCDQQTHRFNEEASKLGKDVVILTLSMDLPFAQKRWCGAAGIHNLQTLSDYKNGEFGQNFGVMIKELHLLSRAVFLIDKEGIVIYAHYVKEVSEHPDYEQVLKSLTGI